MVKTEKYLLECWRPLTSGDTSIEQLGEGPECDPSSNDESMLKAEGATQYQKEANPNQRNRPMRDNDASKNNAEAMAEVRDWLRFNPLAGLKKQLQHGCQFEEFQRKMRPRAATGSDSDSVTEVTVTCPLDVYIYIYTRYTV